MLITQLTSIAELISGYQLCAASEGKSPHTIAIVTNAVRYFCNFLVSQGCSGDVTGINHNHIRSFVLYLKAKKRFADHPFNKVSDKDLSDHTINCYLRSLRVFFSWLVSEEIIQENPFHRVKTPKVPRKIVPTFTDEQIRRLLSAINTKTKEGYRDYCIIVTLLDCAIRVSELCSLRLADFLLDEGQIRVWGKGNKQRLIPVGRYVQRCLWKYVTCYRPQPIAQAEDFLFLTRDGRPLTKDRVERIVSKYGRKAGIAGVRCSPHTFRHSAAVRFLRHGGNVFSLQRMLGHSCLEMTRHYCELADVDVKEAHKRASPVDNLRMVQRRKGCHRKTTELPA